MPIDNLSAFCISRLTRLLDLNVLEQIQELEKEGHVTQNVEIETTDDEVDNLNGRRKSIGRYEEKRTHLRRVKRLFRITSGKSHPHQVFGCRLTEETIETIIALMDHLKKYAHVEGLFRISGNKRRQDELKNGLNKGMSLLPNEDCFNPHDIATVLKQFFAELPEPILHQSLFHCYKQVAGKLREMDGENMTPKKVKILQYLFLMLPPLNRLLLHKLVELLNIVAQSPSSKMSSYNLGVVFAPNVICSKKLLSCLDDYADNMEPLTDVIDFVVQQGVDVFKDAHQFGSLKKSRNISDPDQSVRSQTQVKDLSTEVYSQLTDTLLERYVTQRVGNIPDELLQEYRMMKGDEEGSVGEVPLVGTYCKQVDVNQFRKETQANTNDALTDLYAGVLEMPDGPLKDQFLSKFKKSYPGTPPFIPQKTRLKTKLLQSAPASRVANFTSDRKRTSDSLSQNEKTLENEVFLSTPEKRKLFADDDFGSTPSSISKRLSEARRSPITPGSRLRSKLGKFRRSSIGMRALSTLKKLPTPELRGKLKMSSRGSKSKVTPVSFIADLEESPRKRRRKSLFPSTDAESTGSISSRTSIDEFGGGRFFGGSVEKGFVTILSDKTPDSNSIEATKSDSGQTEDASVKGGFPCIRAPLFDMNAITAKKLDRRTLPSDDQSSKYMRAFEPTDTGVAKQFDDNTRAGNTPAKLNRQPIVRSRRRPLRPINKVISVRDSPSVRAKRARTDRRVTFASYSSTPRRDLMSPDRFALSEEAEWQQILEARKMTDEVEEEKAIKQSPFPTEHLCDLKPATDKNELPTRRTTINVPQTRRSDSDVVSSRKSLDIFDVYTRRLSGSTLEWLQSKHPFLDNAGPPTFL